MYFQGEACFIKKTYSIYLESVTFISKGCLNFLSINSGIRHEFEGKTTVNIRKTFRLSAIDIIYKLTHNVDKEISLQLCFGESAIGKITFDVEKQKIINKQSATLFKKQIDASFGYIYYKFVGCSTSIIKKEDFEAQLGKKGEVVQKIVRDFEALKREKDQWQQIFSAKDKIIRQLRLKTDSFQAENLSLKNKMQKQIFLIKKGMNIQTNLKNIPEVRNCSRKFDSYERMIAQYQKKVVSLQEENESLYDRINDLLQQSRVFQRKINSNVQSEYINGSMLQSQVQEFIKKESLDNKSVKQASEDKKQGLQHQVIRQVAQVKHQEQIMILPGKQNDNIVNQIQPKLNTPLENTTDKNLLSTKNQLQFIPSFQKLKEETKVIREVQSQRQKIPKKRSQKSPKQKVFKQIIKQTLKQNENSNKALNDKEPQENKKVTSNVNNFIQISAATNEKICTLEYEIKCVTLKLQTKQKEIGVLENQLKKKDKEIEKIKQKQTLFNKNLKFMQNEKARLLSNLALNTLGTSDNIDTLTALKQLTNYNKQLLKEKDDFLNEISCLKSKVGKLQETVSQEEQTIKSNELKITELTEEKKLWKAKQKGLKMNMSKLSSIQQSSLSESRIVRMKNQVINYEKQLKEMGELNQKIKEEKQLFKRAIEQKNKQKNQRQEQIVMLHKQIEVKEYENRRFKALLQKNNEQLKQSLSLNQRYKELQNRFESVRKVAVKVQNQYNRRAKKQDIQFYRGEMQKIIGILFVTINDFEVDFYKILQNSLKTSSLALGKYYQQLIQAETDKFNKRKSKQIEDNDVSAGKKTQIPKGNDLQQLRKRKQLLQQEKYSKLKVIDEQRKLLNQKKQGRLLRLEEEIASFQQGVEFVQSKINELLFYKQKMGDFFGNEVKRYMEVPESIANKNSSGINISINQPSLLHQSSIKDVKQIVIKQLNEEEVDKFEQENDQSEIMSKDSSMDYLQVDGKQSLKKTCIYKKSLLSSGLCGFTKLSTSIAIKTNLMKGETQKNEGSMFGSFLNKSGTASTLTLNQVLSLSRQLIDERSKMRQIQIKNFKEQAKLSSNLFQEKVAKDLIVIRHEQRERELQLQFQRAKNEYERQIKDLQKKMKKQQEKIAEIDILGKEKDDLFQKINSLKRQLEQTVDLLQLLNKEKEDLEKKCFQLELQMGRLMEAELEMKVQMENIRYNYLSNQEKLRILIEQRVALYESAEQAKNKEIQKLEIKIKRLQEDVESQMLNSMNINQQKTELIEQYCQQIKQLNQSSQELKQEINFLNQERSQLYEERSCLLEQNEKLRSAIDQLVLKNQESDLELLKTTRMVESYEQEKSMMETMEKQLQERVEEMKRKWEENCNQQILELKKWEENYRNLQMQISTLAERQKKMKLQCQRLSAELVKINEKGHYKQKEILKLQKQMSIKILLIQNLVNEKEFLIEQNKEKQRNLLLLKQNYEQQRQDKANLLRSQFASPNIKKKGLRRLDSLKCTEYQADDTFLNGVTSKLTSPASIIPGEIDDKEIDYHTPIVQFLEEDDFFKEFSDYCIASLIQEIQTLRVEVSQCKADLSDEKKQCQKFREALKARCIESDRQTQFIKGQQKIVKEQKQQIVKYDLRLKKYQKQLKEKKRIIEEQEQQVSSAIKEVVKYSKLSSQFQLQSQQLRMEVTKAHPFSQHLEGQVRNRDENKFMIKCNENVNGIDCSSERDKIIISLRKQLSSVRQQLIKKCDALREARQKCVLMGSEKYKQKYEEVVKEMNAIVMAYKKIQEQNFVLRGRLNTSGNIQMRQRQTQITCKDG